MVNQQLSDYIKQQLSLGTSPEQIKNSLLSVGWQLVDVEAGLNLFGVSNLVNVPNPVYGASQIQQPQKTIIIAVVILALVGLLSAGGVFAYNYYFNSPEMVIGKMIDKISTIKSLEYSGEIKVEMDVEPKKILGEDNAQASQDVASQNQKDNILIELKGLSDFKEPNNPKSSFSLSINSGGTTDKFSIGAETRSLEHVSYFRLTEFSLGLFDLSMIKNQWIKMDIEAIKKAFGLGNFEGQIKSIQKGTELTPEQINKIKLALQKSKVITITKKLPSEKLDGMDMWHYQFMVNKDNIKALVNEISLIVDNKSLTEKDLADLAEGLKMTDIREGQIWIGKKDFLPYKLAFELTRNKKTKGFSIFQITLLAKNFNQPMQIEAPADSKTIEEMMGGLLGELSDINTGTTAKPKVSLHDSIRISDLKRMQSALEQFYINNGHYPIAVSPITLGDIKHVCLNDQGFTVTGCAKPYLGRIFDDPGTGAYSYTAADGKTYAIAVTLEGDADVLKAGENIVTPGTAFGINVNGIKTNTTSTNQIINF